MQYIEYILLYRLEDLDARIEALIILCGHDVGKAFMSWIRNQI